MSDELLPCPFCGSKAEMRERGKGGSWSPYIVCTSFMCYAGVDGTGANRALMRDNATKIWNRRVGAAPTQGAPVPVHVVNEEAAYGPGAFAVVRSAPTQGADARPVAIYQGRVVGDTRWDDLSKDVHNHMQNKPQIFETRIVYATRDAAPTRYGYVYEWDYSPGVVHRSFDCAPYNGRQPDRTVEVFRAAIAPREKTE